MGLLSKSIAVYVLSTSLFQELRQTVGSVAGCSVVDKHVERQRKVLAAAGRYLWSQAVTHTVSCKCSLAVGLHDKQVFSGIRDLSWGYHQ